MEKMKKLLEQSPTSFTLLTLQITLWFTIIFDIPVIRQVIGFVYLTFVPGFVILRLLKLDIDKLMAVLLSVGLSIAFLMGIGLALNTIGPLFGATRPLTLNYLVLVISVTVVFLLLIGWRKQISHKLPSAENVSPQFKSWKLIAFAIAASVLPILSAIGASFASPDSSNVILFVSLILMAVMVAAVGLLNRKLSGEFFIICIFAGALALLFHMAFFSERLMGFDIWTEYSVFRLTLNNAYWNPVISSIQHSMLSVTVLPTIYSTVIGLNGNWVLKIVYPLIFAFVPLGLYQLFKSRVNKEIAFLSVFFFIAYVSFFNDLVYLPRQMIGEIFYVLLFLIIFSKEIKGWSRWFLLIFFSFGLIVSHYSLTYLFLAFAVVIFVVSTFRNTRTLMKPTFIVSFAVITFFWYIYTASSKAFSLFIDIGNNIRRNFFSDLLVIESRGSEVILGTGLGGLNTFWHIIGRSIFYITELFIIIGFLMLFLKRKKRFLKDDYSSLIFLNMILIFFCIVVPNFAASFNMSRFYHVSLFFLAPLCILGGIKLLTFLLKKRINPKYFAPLILLFVLIPYFLFQTGFVYEYSGEESWSLPLSSYRFDSYKLASRGVITEAEVKSAEWVSAYMGGGREVYSDVNSAPLVYANVANISGPVLRLPQNSSWCFYLRQYNIETGIVISTFAGETFNVTDITPKLDNTNLVYADGANLVFASPD